MTLNSEALNRYQNRNGLRQRGRSWVLKSQGGRSEVLKSSNAQNITDILSTGANETPENTGETLVFGLTLAEKSSIEADINAKKPIGDTPAYQKFLKAIFPDKSPTFPYLGYYDDALTIVSKLSLIFSKPVRLPTKEEALKSLKDNNHLTGFRDASTGEIVLADDYGYAWLSGEARGEVAPYAWRDRSGDSNSCMLDHRDGRSVIPIFG